MKDRSQKSLALKYVVGKRWFPQLEVEIESKIVTSKSKESLTDIDLLALAPDDFDGLRTIYFDCKTKKNESPIGRVFWLRGLIEARHASHGFCILKNKNLVRDHRYAASELGITLLAEDEFSSFSSVMGVDIKRFEANIANIDLWDIFNEIKKKYPTLGEGIDFSRYNFWQCTSDAEACRKTLAVSLRLSQELNPSKKEHLCLVADLASLLMVSISTISNKIFAAYLHPPQEETLSEALLILLYGGKESYEYRNNLIKIIKKQRGQEEQIGTLSPPQWPMFTQLVRHCLDSPLEASKVPLLLREIAWSFLSPNADMAFAKKIMKENRNAGKLSIVAISYLCKASKLPPEFNEMLCQILLSLQEAP